MGRKAEPPRSRIWWYTYWRFVGAHLAAPPEGGEPDLIANGRIELAFRGRRRLGALLLGLGSVGAAAFVMSAVVLLTTAFGAAPDREALFQATVICGICFPFFMLALRGADELLRHRHITIANGTLSVAQGGLLLRSSGWALPTSAILGVGLYSVPGVRFDSGGTGRNGADWHIVDLALRHRRYGPLILLSTRDRAKAERLRTRLCAALDCPALVPPDDDRGPTLRYLLTSIALALTPTVLSLIAVAVGDSTS